MIIKNATRHDIEVALEKANKEFGNNLEFNNFVSQVKHYRVTLRVKDSHGKGARLGYRNHDGKQRHLINACWHAHGTFFDNLPEQTIIKADTLTIQPGDQWEDRNIGSVAAPMYYSEACEC